MRGVDPVVLRHLCTNNGVFLGKFMFALLLAVEMKRYRSYYVSFFFTKRKCPIDCNLPGNKYLCQFKKNTYNILIGS
jgi:hypothetical protein